MSTRAIAPVVGVSDWTVRQDQGARRLAPAAVDYATGEVARDYPDPTPQPAAPVVGVSDWTVRREVTGDNYVSPVVDYVTGEVPQTYPDHRPAPGLV